jgi:hypothetical protein
MTEDIAARLAAPFPPEIVEWRIGATTTDKARGMALAYIDARDVQDRLDQVCGIFWQVKHHYCGGEKLACDIGIKIGEEWLWRGDGAGSTDVEAEKGAFSDSFKRAAVRWGVGRYLYDLASPWVELEAKGKTHIIPERELTRLRGLLTRPAQAPQKPASAPSYPPTANGNDSSPRAPAPPAGDLRRHPRYAEATEAYKRIQHALQTICRTPTQIDAVIGQETRTLSLIKEVSEDGYAALMSLANGKKIEMLGATA